MKVLCLILFCCVCPLAHAGQSSGSNVTVVQKKWSIEVRNPALDKNPVTTMRERQAGEIQRKDTDRANEMLSESGMPAQTRTVPVPESDTTKRGLTIVYVYEMKVTNTGTKGIRKLAWDYVFFEPGTETEVGRRRFVSKVRIGAGKTKSVIVRTLSSPTGAVDASKAGKKPREQYSEQVLIQGVEYSDCSVWQAVSN